MYWIGEKCFKAEPSGEGGNKHNNGSCQAKGHTIMSLVSWVDSIILIQNNFFNYFL